MDSFWTRVNSKTLSEQDKPLLAQGDYLAECFVPLFDPGFGKDGDTAEVPMERGDLIVVTQTCDLANEKLNLVALCPIYPLGKFEEINPNFSQKGTWEQVRKGRLEGLHLLASPAKPDNNRDARVVDFRQIVSLPFEHLLRHAEEMKDRWRLASPYLEHFSQAFARFFMRVGLPSSIPPYK